MGDIHGYKRYEGVVDRATRLLKEDKPLPVDLQMKLLDIGIHLDEFEDNPQEPFEDHLHLIP